jgi:adenylate cyclase
VLLRAVGEALEPPIVARGGEVVVRLGDGLMAAFGDTRCAVDAALEAHAAVGAIAVDGYRPALRSGIHVGRPRRIGGDYLGVDVNIAARLAEAAGPGEILVSERALRAMGAAAPASHTQRRRVQAKGVPADFIAHALRPGT